RAGRRHGHRDSGEDHRKGGQARHARDRRSGRRLCARAGGGSGGLRRHAQERAQRQPLSEGGRHRARRTAVRPALSVPVQLSAKFDPARPENAGKTEVKFKAEAIKEAFVTLANPATRAQYDKTLAARLQPPVQILEAVEPFWTIPKLTVLVLIVIIVGGYYYKHQREETRLAAEKAIATAKAKEAQEQAKAEEVRARLQLAKEQQERIQ